MNDGPTKMGYDGAQNIDIYALLGFTRGTYSFSVAGRCKINYSLYLRYPCTMQVTKFSFICSTIEPTLSILKRLFPFSIDKNTRALEGHTSINGSIY